MSKKKCLMPQCAKKEQRAGYCTEHFEQAFGIPLTRYYASRHYRGEDCRVVSARVKAEERDGKPQHPGQGEIIKKASKPAFDPVREQHRDQFQLEGHGHTGFDLNIKKIPVIEAEQRLIAIPVDLYDKLVAMGQEEMRPVEYQLAYLLKKAGVK